MNPSALLLLVVLAGCSPPAEFSVSSGDGDDVSKVESVSFQKQTDPEQDLGLLIGGDTLYLGIDQETAIEMRPPVEKALEFNMLPPQFDEKMFDAFGWETNGYAYGGISQEQTDRVRMQKTKIVVQAMYTVNGVEDGDIDSVLADYTSAYGDPNDALPGSRIGYWFWSKPGRRLMVCKAVDPSGKKSMTVALGETQTMTLLGMSPEQARKDKDLAIERLNQASQE